MNIPTKIALCAAFCASSAFAKIATLGATPENIKILEDRNAQIIDVRTPAEWQETGVIKGAKLVTLIDDEQKFQEALKEAGVDLTKPVAFVCRSGRRSMHAAQLVDSDGRDVASLDGGMSELIKKGFKTAPYEPTK
jgi:hypothetical protein